VLGPECSQLPFAGLQVSVVQALPSSQLVAVPPVQVPFWHVSVVVQALPSLQEVPLPTGGWLEHAPLAGLHVPAAWHWSMGGQVTGAPLVQTPFWHVSGAVQRLPSVQAVPLGAVPFAGQVSELPVQVSAESHGPADARQVTLAAAS